MIDENYGFRSDLFTAYLPDADPAQIFFTWSVKSGGTKSTDTSITMDITYNGPDHLRYIIRHAEELPFTFDDINAIARGESEYKVATSELTINFDQGYGDYRILALAMDANDRYIGEYGISTFTSNLAPAGTWQSIGRGIWHHPYPNTYQYNEFLEDNVLRPVYIEFPADKLQWEVEIEKRTDTDREIYRVVNPYSPSCAIAGPFNDTLDKIAATRRRIVPMHSVPTTLSGSFSMSRILKTSPLSLDAPTEAATTISCPHTSMLIPSMKANSGTNVSLFRILPSPLLS